MAGRDRRTIGANIRARRKALDLTQAQLAEAIGCGPDFVYRLERGERSLPFESYPRVAALLQIYDYSQLFKPRAFL